MEITQDKFKNEILIVAKHINKLDFFNILLKETSLPEICKLVVVELFIDGINDYFVKEDNVYRAIQFLKEYLRELRNNGYVNFK